MAEWNKNNCSILGLTKVSCNFVTSDFPSENPRTQNRNFPYTRPLAIINSLINCNNKNLIESLEKEKI